MKHLKKTLSLLMLLTVIPGSRIYAQDYFGFIQILESRRAKEVRQNNEYITTGYEQGTFVSNPLMLDNKPLDYDAFSLESKGELTVIKQAAITGKAVQVPFQVYLRRGGNKVIIPGNERPDPKQIKFGISEILRYAKPGDQLVIEPVRREDGPAKRILKLLKGGC